MGKETIAITKKVGKKTVSFCGKKAADNEAKTKAKEKGPKEATVGVNNG